jgi:TnpA family transposase
MIYWHVEKNSVCVYSQLKVPSSSEVTSMIEGVLRHDTEMDIEKQYVDTQWPERSGLCVLLPLGL